jgi:hypothetical protein
MVASVILVSAASNSALLRMMADVWSPSNGRSHGLTAARAHLASSIGEFAFGELSQSGETRRAILEKLLWDHCRCS